MRGLTPEARRLASEWNLRLEDPNVRRLLDDPDIVRCFHFLGGAPDRTLDDLICGCYGSDSGLCDCDAKEKIMSATATRARELIDEAIRDGRIEYGSGEVWARLFEQRPDDTATVLAGLPPDQGTAYRNHWADPENEGRYQAFCDQIGVPKEDRQ